jgi:hypothetical protein
VEAQKRVAVEIAEQFVDLSQGKNLFGAVSSWIYYFGLSRYDMTTNRVVSVKTLSCDRGHLGFPIHKKKN